MRISGRRSPAAEAVTIRRGVLDTLPLLPANLLWGAAYGSAAASVGLSPQAAVAMSAVAWSGTAQMAALGVLSQPVAASFMASLLVSLRFIPMTLTLGVWLADRPRWQRAILGCLVADASFALLARLRDGQGTYLVATWVSLYATWVLGTLVGAVSEHLLPRAIVASSDAVVAAIFAALTVEVVDDRRAGLSAIMAACLAAAGLAVLPISVAMLFAAVAASLLAWCVIR
jgi:branched chain amino acid efflux pump